MSDYQRGPAPGDIQRRSNAPATPEQRAHWLDVARTGLTRAKTGDQEPSWAGDADVDQWEVGM